jgi:microcystin degradation protein MlrC
MLAKATLIIACKEYPHTDYAERGAEMLDLLEAAHLGRIRPVMAAARAPVLGLYPTTVEPMAEFVRDLTAAEKPPILSLSALHGFFDADHAYAGASVIAIADGDPAAAEAEAARQAARFIALAGSQKPLGLPLAEALEEARRRQGLVILADIADNPGGGAAGDDTLMLEALIREFHEPAAIGMIFDPVAVAFARDAGVGGELDLRIGGKIGPRSGQPVDLRVRIMALGEDARQAAFGVGPPRLPLGRTATVRWRSLDIVLTDLRQQVFSRHCFTDNGVDLLSKRLVAVKSTQHFHRDFSAIADHVIWCDPRGELLPSASYNPYRHIRRPIFPVDPLSAVSVSDLDGRPL